MNNKNTATDLQLRQNRLWKMLMTMRANNVPRDECEAVAARIDELFAMEEAL